MNHLTRWKIQLDSNDRELQTIALLEIIETFENLSEENSESIYVLLINADIVSFLSEILSYADSNALRLINKIMCHLSETDDFFKNDFFKALKAYARVINSFPASKNHSKTREKYHHDILFCINLLVKRARERNFNFNDERLSINSLVSSASLNSVQINTVAALDFVNLLVEMMISAPAKNENDMEFRDQKLLEIVKKLKVSEKQLKRLMWPQTKVLMRILSYIPVKAERSCHQNTILKAIVETFLFMMDFSVNADSSKIDNFEMFSNLFYRLLTSEKLKHFQKLQMLNRFFHLNGHNILRAVITENPRQASCFKAVIILGSLFGILVQHWSTSPEAMPDAEMKKQILKLVSTAPLKDVNFARSLPSYEAAMMYVLLKFVDYNWRKEFNSNEVLSNCAIILAVTNTKKLKIHPVIFHMIATLFTATFFKVSLRGNQLLRVSSDVILEPSREVKVLDINYLKWYKTMGHPNKLEFGTLLIEFLSQVDCGGLAELKQEDLKIFDQKLLKKLLVSPSTTSLVLHNNVKTILCHSREVEPEKLVKDFKKLLKEPEKKTQFLLNIMDVLNVGIPSLNDEATKREAGSALAGILEATSTASLPIKLSAIEMTANLLRYEN